MHKLLKAWRRSDEGFGLVELIVVVAIIGILTVVAIPVYGAIQETARTNATNEAAASAYGVVKAAYAEGGKDAAIARIDGINASGNDILIYGYDFDPSDYPSPRQPVTRWNSEGVFKLATTQPTRAAILASTNVEKSLTGEDGDGTMLCIIAVNAHERLQALGFAGSCGPAFVQGGTPPSGPIG